MSSLLSALYSDADPGADNAAALAQADDVFGMGDDGAARVDGDGGGGDGAGAGAGGGAGVGAGAPAGDAAGGAGGGDVAHLHLDYDADDAEEALEEEEDAACLVFGKDFRDAQFLSNAEVALLLSQVAAADPLSENAVKTLEHVNRFGGGGTEARSDAAANELRQTLLNLEFTTEDRLTGDTKVSKLHPYQFVALCNLNPPDVATAKALVPQLEQDFTDDHIDEMLSTLARSTARMLGT